jgi:hypothetical protein
MIQTRSKLGLLLLTTLVGTSFVGTGCQKKTEQVATTDSSQVAPVQQNVTMVPATDTSHYPSVKLTIVSPREGQVIKEATDSVLVVMNVTGAQLGARTPGDSTKGIAFTPQGQHVHVIVDEKPYMANYRNGQPFNVGILTPGLHTIRAFPSFSWHESIKTPGAFATRTFYVGEGPKKGEHAAPPSNNMNGPLLTYSRPKGTYKASESQKILLDFYVTNAKLGPKEYKVQVGVDGTTMPEITKWQPYYLSGLAKGKHTIKLQLVDPQGKPVPGSYNSPSSEITVE